MYVTKHLLSTAISRITSGYIVLTVLPNSPAISSYTSALTQVTNHTFATYVAKRFLG